MVLYHRCEPAISLRKDIKTPLKTRGLKNKEAAATLAWHALTLDQAFAALGSSETGLSQDQARECLHLHGPNQISSKPQDRVFQLLWRQINNPLIWVLLGSGTLAVALGKMTDGLVILAVVLINAIIGFIQEFKAGRAIAALSDMVPQKATVIREGKSVSVDASELVPGDVVQLTAGDSVPADMRLIALKNLQVDEAALTGESLPVAKAIAPVAVEAVLGDRTCMAYSGTLVAAGTAKAVVTATGMATELGRISAMLDRTIDLETPLTKKLGEVSIAITFGIILVSIIILAIGVRRALNQAVPLAFALKDTLIFAITLAVGAIPEGLPAVVTIALAIGVQRMARRNAIIRRLPAVETLGSTTVICSDKTGTLTCNAMTVTELTTLLGHYRVSSGNEVPDGGFITGEGGRPVAGLPEDLRDLLVNMVLCNDAALHSDGARWRVTGDPTESALLVAATKAKFLIEGVNRQFPRLDTIPFTSENQYMATLHGGETMHIAIKGAPEVVLKRCRNEGGEEVTLQQRIMAEVLRMGGQGMRVLAVAGKAVERGATEELSPESVADGFCFSGLIGMIDPPRPEAVAAIQACHQAGIVVKMITGDHRATALAIGSELNLVDNGEAVTGVELTAMDAATLQQKVRTTNIFARVAPEHKLRLVRALQQDHQIVAMTGDGVNDAPSLKQANIGVAMGITGTAVSREAADIVLADDNFASITAAVEEGRRVYDNLIKSLAFLLPTNLGLALILIHGIMFFPYDPVTKVLLLPMLPTQLLWINLVAAVALALPLAFEVKEPDIMRRPPRRPEAPLFTGFLVFRVVLVSLLMTAGTVVLFDMEYRNGTSGGLAETLALAKAQTIAVTYVILFQICYMVHCRSLKDNLLKIGFFSNPMVFWGIGVILALQALFVYLPMMQQVFRTAPLSPRDIGLTMAAALVIFPVISLEKWVRSQLRGRRRRNW